jgi:hypothetical protein
MSREIGRYYLAFEDGEIYCERCAPVLDHVFETVPTKPIKRVYCRKCPPDRIPTMPIYSGSYGEYNTPCGHGEVCESCGKDLFEASRSGWERFGKRIGNSRVLLGVVKIIGGLAVLWAIYVTASEWGQLLYVIGKWLRRAR